MMKAKCSTSSFSLGETSRSLDLKSMRKLLKKYGFVSDAVIADKLLSYRAALKNPGISRLHDFGGRKNNREENSHYQAGNVNDE